MNFFLLLILGVVVCQAIASDVEAVPRCSRKFEIYNACGSACPLTCDNYKLPPACTRECVPGCFCQQGYVRNKAGDCVLPAQCPKVCVKKHEKYTTCGTACPLTCENYKNPPKVCTLQCFIGCECEAGYVRNKADGNCCLPCQCPATQVCPLHEKYNSCGTACPLTCDNYKNPPQICTDQCIIGCECESGYVRKGANGPCCLPSECPVIQPTCNSNEVYNECGSACPRTCANYKKEIACTQQCVQGCFCKSTYVRNEAGKCVLPTEC